MNQREPTESGRDDDLFERELKVALHPLDPPEGFAGRVLDRLQTAPATPARVVPMPSLRRWVASAIAAMTFFGVFAGYRAHQRMERKQQAEAQLQLALEITGRTLQHTREQLSRAGVRLAD